MSLVYRHHDATGCSLKAGRFTVDRVANDNESWPPPAQCGIDKSLSEGFMNESKMTHVFLSHGWKMEETVVLLCGPPVMVEIFKKKTLPSLGFEVSCAITMLGVMLLSRCRLTEYLVSD